MPETDLQAVNGFEGMVRPTIQQAVGPAVAGLVVGAASPAAAFVVAAAASALGLLALTAVPKTPVRRDLDQANDLHPVRSALVDMKEGFAYMVRTPWLLSSLIFGSVMVLVIMGPLDVLIPFLLKDRLGQGPGAHALVLAGFGIGGAVAAIVMGAVPMPRRYLTLMNLAWGVACLPMIWMGFATHVWEVVAAAVICGALFSAPMVIWGTLLQRRVPAALVGRVSSLDFFVSLSLMPVSMALAGPVSEAIGLRTTFFIAGVVPVVVAALAIWLAKLPQDEIANPLPNEPEASPSVEVRRPPGGTARLVDPAQRCRAVTPVELSRPLNRRKLRWAGTPAAAGCW